MKHIRNRTARPTHRNDQGTAAVSAGLLAVAAAVVASLVVWFIQTQVANQIALVKK